MQRPLYITSAAALLLLPMAYPVLEGAWVSERAVEKGSSRVPDALFTFSDGTFDLADWGHEIFVDVNGGMAAGAEVSQDQTNGQDPPSRRIDRQWTCASDTTMRMVDASWADSSLYDPAGDTVESISFWFDYNAAGIAIHPLIVQDDTFYLGPSVQTNFPYVWEFFDMPELREVDFSPFALPTRHPDFSQPMTFGYVSNSSAPPNASCPFRNYRTIWIDNFNVQVNGSEVTIVNRQPRLQDDIMVARSFIEEIGGYLVWRAEGFVEPLRNDFDPDGDALAITYVSDPFIDGASSSTTEVSPGRIRFGWTDPDSASRDNRFIYSVSDGINDEVTAGVHVLVDCACVIECWVVTQGKEDLDVEFIRRFRDEYMEATEHGSRFVDLYYEKMPELLWRLLIDKPELGVQAAEMTRLVQPVLRDLLDGDGQMTVSQEQVDAISQFATDLSLVASDSLKQFLEDELSRLGDLGQFVGQPVAGVAASVLGEPTNVGIDRDPVHEAPRSFTLQQNYPNPFNPNRVRTTISFDVPVEASVRMTLFDVSGRQIMRLIDGRVSPGRHTVQLDGAELPSGVYLYRLDAPGASISRAMHILR